MTTGDIEQTEWRWRLWPRKKLVSSALLPALSQYHSLGYSKVRRFFGLTVLMMLCFVYGFFFSVLAPNFFAFLVLPIVVLSLLVIWALPDVNWAPTSLLEWLFYAFFIVLIVWPNYMAISLPGLPWITLVRATAFPMLLILLICVSISSDFRLKMGHSLRAVSAIPILLCIFVVIQIVSIGLSKDVAGSIQKFIAAQTTWTAIFFASAYIFFHSGQIKRWAAVLCGMAVFVSVIAIWEAALQHVPWRDHIPSFLQINDDAVAAILAGSTRSFTNRYRAQATFGTSLGLAEYLTLSVPFVMHFATNRFSGYARIMALLSLPLILFACYRTDAKLGMIGSLLAILIFTFITSFKSWRINKSGLLATLVLSFYPIGVASVAAALLASHRLQILIFGNDGTHVASTAARVEQYTLGFQKFLEWPFGYGIGMGADTLGFRTPNGLLTIDSYYLSILLEYGIAGFVVYYGIFFIAIYEGGRRSLFSLKENEDTAFLLPLSISLFDFVVIKSVFSQQDNHAIAFMMLGAIVGLCAMQKKTKRAVGIRK
jgi:hypothetical protein